MSDGMDGVRTYELTCTDCSFTSTVECDVDELYDVIEAHREQMERSPADHFVDFEATSAPASTSADD